MKFKVGDMVNYIGSWDRLRGGIFKILSTEDITSVIGDNSRDYTIYNDNLILIESKESDLDDGDRILYEEEYNKILVGTVASVWEGMANIVLDDGRKLHISADSPKIQKKIPGLDELVESSVTKHKCNCDLILMLRDGCTCGGV